MKILALQAMATRSQNEGRFNAECSIILCCKTTLISL